MTYKKGFPSSRIYPLLAMALGACVVAQAQTRGEGETDAAQIGEVVVTGTRAALIESRDRKREAGIVEDSIVAEDLGRFPDDNVADSLSHITGVTVQRTRGGEGQYVSVRGLGPEFSIVTLNGRILATDGDGREFAFDVLPSEVIAGADVYKSALASNLEGSIGGTINLTSARPLDTRGLRVSMSLEGDYNDLSEKDGYKVSGVFSNTFADDRMRADPRHWRSYYEDAANESFDLQYSLSDRIRYYWPYPEVQRASASLLVRLRRAALPLTLLSQYLPRQYEAVRAGRLSPMTDDILHEGIALALRPYARACGVTPGRED